MPVSTRAQISGGNSGKHGRSPSRHQSMLRNPHHGLKEKLKALTLLYEQQRKPLAPSHHPSIDLLDSNRKKSRHDHLQEEEEEEEEEAAKENKATATVENIVFPKKNTTVFSKAKEKQETNICDRVVVYSVPKKAAVVPAALTRRKSTGVASERRSLIGIKKISEESVLAGDMGSRIMVFVRLRPLGKKEEESGARSCVRIDNKKDVYLTEFALEKDYLRLKRVRGRHFCFDASFPESTSQQEVYSTTTAELVEGVLQGRNGTVFCYGATGAGKTYTMLGKMDNPGVMCWL